MFRADMHCHTTCSDGTLSPEEVLHLAKDVGLQGLSITDHDTIVAYTPELFDLAEKLGIELVTGIEFSTVHKSTNVHVLGYGFDIEKIIPFCEDHLERRRMRNEKILEKLEQHGMAIEKEELEGEGRPHIASKLIEKGYARNMSDAFSRFIGEGRPCYARGMPFTAEQTIRQIHEAGGKAFIAHPHFIKRKSLVDSLLTLSFDGIECYYAIMPPAREKEWLEIAKKKNLLISGGSDFHGAIKPDVPLGCSWVDRDTFTRIVGRG